MYHPSREILPQAASPRLRRGRPRRGREQRGRPANPHDGDGEAHEGTGGEGGSDHKEFVRSKRGRKGVQMRPNFFHPQLH
jgi:hypothetical protein